MKETIFDNVILKDTWFTHTEDTTRFYTSIEVMSNTMNQTYIGFGRKGAERVEMQQAQDKNAANYGTSNMATRAASKAKAAYSNEEWDLVDAKSKNKEALKKGGASRIVSQSRRSFCATEHRPGKSDHHIPLQREVRHVQYLAASDEARRGTRGEVLCQTPPGAPHQRDWGRAHAS